MLNLYLLLSTILLVLLGIMWNTNTFLNLFVKAIMLLLSALGIFNLLVIHGYLIKL